LPELIERVLKKHDLKALAAELATKKEKPAAGCAGAPDRAPH
jgi:hypothetical protein